MNQFASASAAGSQGVSIALRAVARSFPIDAGEIRALDPITLDINEGEFVSILGPSGCGKSTLLRIIAGLDQPTSGQLQFSNQGTVAYVFQDAHLLPWRNVLRNVALPLEFDGIASGERLDRSASVLKAVGLDDAIGRYPSQLSGGMRMRVSLARALVTDPRLLLLDEPFAALDEITRAALDQQLRQMWIARRMTVLFVTHSITEATILSDRAIVLSPRPGKVVLDVPIELGLERADELRGEARFAAYTRQLLFALQHKPSIENARA